MKRSVLARETVNWFKWRTGRKGIEEERAWLWLGRWESWVWS